MLPKRTLIVSGLILSIVINIIVLIVNSQAGGKTYGVTKVPISSVGPFQEVITQSNRFLRDIWRHYFFLVQTSKENDLLRQALKQAEADKNKWIETELANVRLRKVINFKKSFQREFLPAEVISRDPAIWFKAIIINKGIADGVRKGAAVVVPEGIVGQIIETTDHYAKVLLLIDQNSAADAIVQSTRARGIIKGELTGNYTLKYVLRKYIIKEADVIISSGMDNVYPRGIKIGYVSNVLKKKGSSIFQEVKVVPFVDFDTLEEVLVITNLPQPNLVISQ